ncbi:phosphatidylserine decarboxylase [Nocardia sp. NPDC004168]|uniref:phosphatidylserine decarboxylase n=1 Tax=Nocardia sp. NPDC004168 TaxID=3154452 RepID=UPI0033AA2DCD
MSEPDRIIQHLRRALGAEDGLAARLEHSLVQARASAQPQLDPALFAALDWPQNLEQYEAYLERFLRWVPVESDAPVWTAPAPERGYAGEVTDRMCHFFWLVDQHVGDDQTAIAESSAAFRDWVTEFAREWGGFLDTTRSFGPEILNSFIDNAPEYRVGESFVDGIPNMPSGWLTFNQFIARELNGGLRPISDPGDNRVITSPADCIFQHQYAIDAGSNIPAVPIKGTHRYGNITRLLAGSRYAESFAGGTFVHYNLPACAYHRFHLPVSGLVAESYLINGKVFLKVEIDDHHLVCRDDAQTGYQFSQTRGVVTIDTSVAPAGDIGIVAVVCVGMSHVGSVVLTAVENRQMEKGQQFGYFQFGGSDIILLFQNKLDLHVNTDDDYRLVGSPAAHFASATNR